jgi:hypothetical protein
VSGVCPTASLTCAASSDAAATDGDDCADSGLTDSQRGGIIGGVLGGVGALACCFGAVLCCAGGKRGSKAKGTDAKGGLVMRLAARKPHSCKEGYAVMVTWVGEPLPAEPTDPPGGRPTLARASVCPHVSLRTMALAAARSLGAIAPDASADDASIQFLVAVNGGPELWTAPGGAAAAGAGSTGVGHQAITTFGITQPAARAAAALAEGQPGGAPLVITLKRGPPAPVAAAAAPEVTVTTVVENPAQQAQAATVTAAEGGGDGPAAGAAHPRAAMEPTPAAAMAV